MMRKKSIINIGRFILLSCVVLTIIILSNFISSEYDPETNSFTHDDGLRYEPASSGIMRIWDEHDNLISVQGFGLDGTVRGQRFLRNVRYWDWTWELTNKTINVTDEGHYPINDTCNMSIFNNTINIPVLSAINDDPSFVLKQYWEFHPNRPVKIRFEFNNNRVKIEDFKVWLINTIDEGTQITYNNRTYEVNFDNSIHLKGHFDDKLPNVNFGGAMTYNYHDVIASGWNITNIIIGNASFIHSPNILIMAVGVTKIGNNTFNVGQTITLDPSDTGFIFPLTTGDPKDEWRNGDYLKADDSNYATANAVDKKEDTSNFTFNANSSWVIEGIEMKIGGYAYVLFGGCSATINASLSWNSGSTSTTEKTGNLPCVPSEGIITYGNATDLWGRSWSWEELDDDFRARIRITALTGTRPEARVDFVKVKVYYSVPEGTAPTPYITINSPANGSTVTTNYALLNWTIEDVPEDDFESWVYGCNDTSELPYSLLFYNSSSLNATFTYNWTAPLVNRNSKDLLLLWHLDYNDDFDELTTNIYDFSGNDNNGTEWDVLSSTPTFNKQGGKFGGGVEFDGDRDCIYTKSGEGLNVTDMTVSAWVYPTTSSTASYLAHKDVKTFGDPDGFQIQFHYSDNNISYHNGTGTTAHSNANAFTLNQWTHLAVTVNSTTTTFYSNGVQWGSSTTTYGITNNDNKLFIGVYGGLMSVNDGFNGTIDEFALWNRTLSTTEISELVHLKDGDWYWNVTADDHSGGISSNLSMFTIDTTPTAGIPYLDLNNPTNASQFTIDFYNIILNTTVYDPDGDTIDAYIYGVNSTSTSDFYKHGLLYQIFGVSNNTEITYNWTSPVTIPDSNTVLLLHLDNNSNYGESNSLIYDFSGNENNGTPMGDAFPNMTGGKFAGAFEFDGDNDYIDCGNGSSFDITKDITMSAWVNIISTSASAIISKKTDDGSSGFGMMVDVADSYLYYQYGGGYDRISYPFNTNQWYHVVDSYDNSTGVVTYYVNGESIGIDTTGHPTITSNNLTIGIRPFWKNYDFNGTIDEVAVWNRSLLDSEVRDLYRLKVDKYFWKVNITDSDGYNNESETREFNIGCSYDCSTISSVTSNVDCRETNLTLTGSGTITLSANITNWDYFYHNGGCLINRYQHVYK